MIFSGYAKESVEGLASRLNALSIERVEDSYHNRKQRYNVWQEESMEGLSIPIIEWQNSVWMLNSYYSPSSAAKVWAEQFLEEVQNANNMFLVFGIGDGRAILELHNKHPKCRILVFEPCEEIFWEVMKMPEVAQVLNIEQIVVFIKGICEEYFFHVLQSLLNYANYQLVKIGILPNYDRIFHNELKEMLADYKSAVELIVFTRNTEIMRGIEIQRNAYALTKDMIQQYSIVQLKNFVKRKGLADIPAILVAAGPSLDKNVNELKMAEGKAFLMVVDTALNTVLEHGILPDMTMTIDSRKPLVLFKHEKAGQIPVALSLNSNYEAVKMNHAKHYYEIDNGSYLDKVVKSFGKDTVQLPTGGSVANNALSLLAEMGFEIIVLVGQDLAYPGGVEHTKLAYNDSQKDKVDITRKEYIEVEDIYGQKVLTEKNMDIYRRWIENYALATKEIKVIDATEGGAKIAGTEIRTLKSVIEEYCKRSIDRKIFFEGEDTYFSKDEQEKLIQKICQIPEDIKKLEKQVENAQKMYRSLQKENRKLDNFKEIQKKMMELGELNQEIEEMGISRLIRPYMAEALYRIEGEVLNYDEKDSIKKQVEDFIHYGQKLMDAYMQGIEELRKDFPLIMKDFE